jgi:hypothetical protein
MAKASVVYEKCTKELSKALWDLTWSQEGNISTFKESVTAGRREVWMALADAIKVMILNEEFAPPGKHSKMLESQEIMAQYECGGWEMIDKAKGDGTPGTDPAPDTVMASSPTAVQVDKAKGDGTPGMDPAPNAVMSSSPTAVDKVGLGTGEEASVASRGKGEGGSGVDPAGGGKGIMDNEGAAGKPGSK